MARCQLRCLLLLQLVGAASALSKEPLPQAPRSAVSSRRGATTLTAARGVPSARGRAASPAMALGPVAASAAVYGAANALGFGISVATNWHYHLDLIGTGVFAISALVVRGGGLVQQVSAGAVSLWAVKLASFLFYRALQVKRDARLEGLLATTSGSASFWFVSFLWAFVVSLPHTVAAAVPPASQPPFGATSAVGLAMFAAGLGLETAADWQKWVFKGSPANAGRFCDVGVWRLTQHPNWFGNLLLWSGLFVMNVPALAARTPGVPGWRRFARLASAALCPLFLWRLFSAQAGGSMLDAAAQAAAKYEGVPGYQAYVDTTPLLFPTLSSLRAWLT